MSVGGKGTGLGLALVRQIVKLTGGRLGVRSKIGEGSTFWVELREFKLALGHRTCSNTLALFLALGVGEKAVCYPADEPFDQELRSEQAVGAPSSRIAGGLLHQHASFLDPSASSDVGTSSTLVDGSRNNSYTPQASSALKTIMEQGMCNLFPYSRLAKFTNHFCHS